MGFGSIFKNFGKSSWFNLVLRSLQLVDALIVIGMYGVDLNAATKADKYVDGKWVLAVTVGSLAAVTSLIFSLANIFFAYRTVALLFAWDWIITVLFAVLSGIFASMYMNEAVEMESGIQRMKNAVGFDLAGLILWFITASVGLWAFWRSSKSSAPRVEIRPDREWQGSPSDVPRPAVSFKNSMSSRSFRR